MAGTGITSNVMRAERTQRSISVSAGMATRSASEKRDHVFSVNARSAGPVFCSSRTQPYRSSAGGDVPARRFSIAGKGGKNKSYVQFTFEILDRSGQYRPFVVRQERPG